MTTEMQIFLEYIKENPICMTLEIEEGKEDVFITTGEIDPVLNIEGDRVALISCAGSHENPIACAVLDFDIELGLVMDYDIYMKDYWQIDRMD
tara:strand:- start:8 stop:286 length:279 start_codon:yes stop_codon:yes gene_type:complete